jgi:hypothetical protein
MFDGDVVAAEQKIKVLKNFLGIENLFECSDIKLIKEDAKCTSESDKVSILGKKKKAYYSSMFYNKVLSKKIKKKNLSKKVIERYENMFRFISEKLK